MTRKNPTTQSESASISYPVRVQAIRTRGQAPRLYVTVPMAIAAAIGLEPGDDVQWELLDREELHLVRVQASPPLAKGRVRQPASPS